MSVAMEQNIGVFDPALAGLLESLVGSRDAISASKEELDFLSNLLQSKELHALFKVYNTIVDRVRDDRRCSPVLSSSMQTTLDVMEVILPRISLSDTSRQLFQLLQNPHIQGLLCAHDAVAQKDYLPRLPDIPQEMDEDEETIKIVQLVKSTEPLGATIKTDEENGKIIIARVMHGGAADRSGLINVGDEVCEVNGINVEGKSPADVLQILQHSEGTITFKLIPADPKNGSRESKMKVRAHFDFNTDVDPYIPCKEAGLSFAKGEVLHIVSQDDPYWWQARKEGDRNMRAGLIPSKALQERKIIHERLSMTDQKKKWVMDTVNGGCIGGGGMTCLPDRSLAKGPLCGSLAALNDLGEDMASECSVRTRVKKVIYDAAESDDYDREDIATYEEVVKLYPRNEFPRPIVLVGPPGVGRNELKRRIMELNPDKYHTPVPHTSRSPRPGEVNGKEYNFVSRELMEEQIARGEFLEFGEYKGNLYGTSLESVKSIIRSGLTCIINPHYQALKMLRTPDIKPYIVYIKPPVFDILKSTRNAAFAMSTFDETNSRGFTDDEFNEILRSSKRIEFLYDHWFDEVIVNDDFKLALEQLLEADHKLKTEPLWAPAAWLQ
ncbi:MAGUK p55 subfamily member 7 isoform X2 [Acyrthosiphon pisum]|uniref:MAGUK p55 subfamily member 7 n=1 Tax=Acyrthosiphon pisum TaxID=7029 RepID=A0A8R2B4V1_ACYPI|nr:MAGUK p55 subfamily member 7 isoform X2 [Acyrthosiphon pisum]|eukprot:XP_008181814.1 PREDICTED: MAGUK p55 subfamily member 7 isoform X2 [Acyrthosiphon pisum]